MKSRSPSRKISKRGGTRPGAGRPNLSGTVGHGARSKITARTPLLITLTLRPDLPNPRKSSLFKNLRVSALEARKFGLSIVHFAIQPGQIQLLVEVRDNVALGRGMRSLGGRFGKSLRAHFHRYAGVNPRGTVFLGRYRMQAIRSPLQMRESLQSVLLLPRKQVTAKVRVNEFSTASYFTDWKLLLGSRMKRPIGARLDRSTAPSGDFGVPASRLGQAACWSLEEST